MPPSWLPLLAFTAGAMLVIAGVAFVYWPAAFIVAGLTLALTAVDFGTAGGEKP